VTPLEVAIFDFDGTIVDSMSFLTRLATDLLVRDYGMEREKARQAYVETTGLPFVKQMELIFPGDARNRSTVDTFEEGKRSSLFDFKIFPEVPGALDMIRRKGIKVCVSSGNYEDVIAEVLGFRGLEFDLIMGFRPGFEKGLDHFRFAMETFDAGAEEVLFVGDSRKDGLAALSAGIRFIARTGLLSAEEFSRVLPGVPTISSLDEVLPLVGISREQDEKGRESL
jgi:phosphoglycolate phosphatase-like HAD superfamily hydrolase